MSSHIVYSNVSVSSTAGEVTLGQHTDAIYFLNLDNSTNAQVKLNGGPHIILIPHSNHKMGYVKIPGDYTSFQIMTTSVSLSVFAVG